MNDAPALPMPDLHNPAWVELLPDAVCVLDTNYDVVSMTAAGVELDDLFHVADHDEISQALAQCRQVPGKAVRVPGRYLDGAKGWRQGVVSVTDWTTNSLVNSIVITWRPTRASDGSGNAVLDALRLVVETSTAGLWVIEPGGQTLYVNAMASRLLHRSSGVLSSLPIDQVLPADVAARLAAPSGCPTSFVCSAVAPDGSRFDVAARSTPLTVGGTGELRALVIEVTAPQTDDALSHAVRRALTDSVPVGIFELDAQCCLTEANRAWQTIMGPFATTDPFGWTGKVHPEDRPRIDAALAGPRTGTWFSERYRIRRDIDEWGWIETTVTAVADTSHHVGTTADVDTAVMAEEQIAHARDAALETSRMKSEFLANMSHEIRTPLNGVIGMATLLLDTPLNRDQRDRVVTLRSAGEHLLGLVNDILDFSKVETGKLELERVEFDLLPVISQVVSLYSSAGFDKGVRLRVDTDASLPRSVVGDPSRLRQILSNLVGNAIKFTESGSVTIRVTAEGRRSPIVRFEVIDTGIGISTDAQAKIFEPFVQADNSTTRKFGGTGLGLPISRHLVDLMGGVLSVESKSGQGSTFWFTIPFADASETNAPRVEADVQHDDVVEAITQSTVRGKVLLVEDNPINQKVATGFLAHLGWETDVANDGLEAVDAVMANHYAVILMDCQMPRMDGYEATARIRVHERTTGTRTSIIALTAGAMPGDRERCLEAGMDDYLSKPIDVSRLDALLRHWARDVASTVTTPEAEPAHEPLHAETVSQLRSIPSGSTTLFDEAAQQFLVDAPTRVAEVVEAANDQAWSTMAKAAHAVKGMSATVGATRLADTAETLQRIGHADAPDPRVVDGLLARLAAALDDALTATNHELRLTHV